MGGARGAPPSPVIFGPNWGPKGRKSFLGDLAPTPPLSKSLDDRPHPLSQGMDPALLN